MWLNFGQPPRPRGTIQSRGGVMEQGSSIPPWSWVGTHRPSWISPNLNILRPLLGPGGVARCLPPRHLPFVWEEMGTPGWDCPTRHRSRSPPAFSPSIAGHQKYIGGDFGVDELQPRESPGLALPPPSHSVPQPKDVVTMHGPPDQDTATTPAKPGGLS